MNSIDARFIIGLLLLMLLACAAGVGVVQR